ncbi:LysE/ArgO family amino acid transporter [Pseudactinotalea terrae]|uniref:LysE/ArgO family amino acid transporter n=1 Tax=Pseudactinotalea terrae TaxID=1743262 RepID=UPI001F5027C2|nr:LysE/ArgO family amino acid transporter [Pseudactinotalea terrae]
MLPLLSGLAAGLSLIVAIGAQNTFVLRQGLARSNVGLVVLVCAASDAVLIAAGVAGLGALVTHAPVALEIVRWGGAAFLLGYGARAAIKAWRGESMPDPTERRGTAGAAVLATALALTWLNPHVYLDTVVLLGSMAATHGADRWWFALGAMTGSVLWFTALGLGARLLVPVFRRRSSWRVLDGAIAVVMVVLAAQLLLRHST